MDCPMFATGDKGEKMIKLLKNAEVYTPEYIGKKDILIAGSKVAKIEDSIDIEVGFDADLVILDEELNIDSVLALGRVMVENKIPIVKGTFEK